MTQLGTWAWKAIYKSNRCLQLRATKGSARSADPLRPYIPPFILSLHTIMLMTRICLGVRPISVCPDIFYHFAISHR